MNTNKFERPSWCVMCQKEKAPNDMKDKVTCVMCASDLKHHVEEHEAKMRTILSISELMAIEAEERREFTQALAVVGELLISQAAWCDSCNIPLPCYCDVQPEGYQDGNSMTFDTKKYPGIPVIDARDTHCFCPKPINAELDDFRGVFICNKCNKPVFWPQNVEYELDMKHPKATAFSSPALKPVDTRMGRCDECWLKYMQQGGWISCFKCDKCPCNQKPQ